MNLMPDEKMQIIAEVGQNHQGSLETALEYIKVFSAAGADVIKFQTRNNRYFSSMHMKKNITTRMLLLSIMESIGKN